jgi:hypothetical protein
MAIRRIKKRIRHQDENVQVAADIDGVVATNVGRPGQTTRSTVRSRQRIVQRSGSARKQEEPDREQGGAPDG